MSQTFLYNILQKHAATFHHVVQFDAEKDRLLKLDFTVANKSLNEEILADTDAFTKYIENLLGETYRYGIGGYAEHRTIYSRSHVFDGDEEPRRLHLGIDIWGRAGTPVFAPMDGRVHSFAFNDQLGDYGATIILQHQLKGVLFHTLYGHVTLKDLDDLREGKFMAKGTEFARFGTPEENGQWPPHLHFQLISEMNGKKGDFEGVCKFSEREKYLMNCPDPDVILCMMKHAVDED
jgi:murein DD-endopeptidase MepM/ murein hydrolase activator NlpD